MPKLSFLVVLSTTSIPDSSNQLCFQHPREPAPKLRLLDVWAPNVVSLTKLLPPHSTKQRADGGGGCFCWGPAVLWPLCRVKAPVSTCSRGPTQEGLHPNGACWCCWSPRLTQTIPDDLVVILRVLCCSRPLCFMWTCSHLFHFILAHYLYHLVDSRWVWERGMSYKEIYSFRSAF